MESTDPLDEVKTFTGVPRIFRPKGPRTTGVYGLLNNRSQDEDTPLGGTFRAGGKGVEVVTTDPPQWWTSNVFVSSGVVFGINGSIPI